MNSYQAPLADLRFALFDVLEAEAVYARLGMPHAQRDVMDAVLEEGARFTSQVLAPLHAIGDQVGCVHDPATGTVATPPGFRQAYAQFVEGGWTGLTAPEAMGGQDLPESLGAAIKEMLDASNLAWSNYPLLSHAARVASRSGIATNPHSGSVLPATEATPNSCSRSSPANRPTRWPPAAS